MQDQTLTTRGRLLARFAPMLVALVALSACTHDETGPLELGGGSGMVLDPIARGAWFDLSGCARDEDKSPVDIMITKVVPTRVTGGDVSVRVAWDKTGEDVFGAPGTPPAEYRPVDASHHIGGTLTDCSLSVALILPPATNEPVTARGLDVTYTTADKTYTAHGSFDLTLCPRGTHAGDIPSRPCEPDSSQH